MNAPSIQFRNHSTKFAIILVLVSISLCLIYFAGRGSPWVARHNLIGYLTFKNGSLPHINEVVAEDIRRTPTFYPFLAALIGVSGIDKWGLMFYPLLLAPISTVLYALLYRISENHVFSATILAGYFLSGINGSDKVFIGLHGTGFVLLFTSLLLLLLFRDYWGSREVIFVPLTIVSITLLYISYNRTASMIFTLGFLALLFIMATKRDLVYDTALFSEDHNVWRFPVFVIFAIFTALIFFHTFLQSFIPFFFEQLYAGTQTGLDRYLLQWFGSGDDSFPINEIVLQKPESIVYISAVRYLLLLVAFLIFTGILLQTIYRQDQGISYDGLVVAAFVAGQAVFAVVRLLIGDTQFIVHSYFPALLVLAYLIAKKPTWRLSVKTQTKIRSFVVLCAVALLVLSALPLPISLAADQVNNDATVYRVTEEPAEWHSKYVENPMRTDEQTSNNMRYHTDDEIGDIHRFTRIETILFVLNSGDENPEEAYIVLNYALNDVPIGGWTHLQSWSHSSREIHSGGENTHLVYSSGVIRTYAPNDN